MVAGIIALITALAVAIPTIWAAKQYFDKKKAAKDLEKRKQDIRKAVTSGDINAVRDELSKWL